MIFSLRRKNAMKKWKSDTPHKLQDGGVPPIPGIPPVPPTTPPVPPVDTNATGVGAGNAAIAAVGNVEEPGGKSPMEGAIGMAKGMGIKRAGGTAPGKFLRQGGAVGRKLL